VTPLQELARTFNQQLRDPSSQGRITIDEAVLGTAGFDALLARSLGLAAGELKVSVPGGSVPDPGEGPLAFSGSASLLGLTAQQLALTFLLDAGAIVLDLVIVPSGTWTFGTSFPDLIGTEFEMLTHPGDQRSPWARLVFASFDEHNVPDAPNPTALAGLNFSADILVSGLFEVLLELLAPSRGPALEATPPVAPLTGLIELLTLGNTAGESVRVTSTRLQATLLAADQPPDGLTIGPVEITELYVAIENRYVSVATNEPMASAGPIEATTVAQATSVCFGGTTSVFKRAPVAMEVDLTNTSRTGTILALHFQAATPNTNIVELSDLVGLLGASEWQETIPAEFSGSSWLSFGLSGAGVTFLLASGPSLTLLELSANMGLREPWVLYTTQSGTNFTLHPLNMGFRVLSPSSPARMVSGGVDTVLSVGAPGDPHPFVFSAGVTFASGGVWSVSGRYLGGLSLSLDELNGRLFPDSKLPNPQGRFFAGVAFCQPGFTIAFDANRRALKRLLLETGLDARLDLFGAKIFELSGGELAVEYTPQGGTAGRLAGTVFIVEIGFTITAAVEAKGLKFEGRQLVSTPIELMKLAGQLLPGSLEPPGGSRLAVSGLALQVDTVAATYGGSGKVEMQWPLQIGGGAAKLVTDLTASVSSSPATLLLPAPDPALPTVPAVPEEDLDELGAAIVRHRQAAHGPQPELSFAVARHALVSSTEEALPVMALAGTARSYEVALSGTLELTEHFAIALGFKYARGKTTITGSWEKSATQQFDWEDLAGALQIPTSGLALPGSVPEFPLAKLALLLELGGQSKTFQLSGETPAHDAGYFLARSTPQIANGSWGFAVGVMLPVTGWAITSIPELASVLKEFGFKSAAVLISSFTDPSFTVASLFPSGAVGVVAGFNFYADFELASNKNPDLVFARDEFAQAHTPQASVVASVGNSTGGFAASFRVLLNIERKIGVFAIEHLDLGFSMQGDVFSIWAELDLSTPVHGTPLLFGGRAEVRNEGFDALLFLDTSRFPDGAWHDAFDVSGLTIASAALMLGVDAEGIPSFGVAGQLAYEGFTGTIAAILDSQTEDPTKNQSMFVASVSDFTLGDLVKLLAGAAKVDPGIVHVLNSIGISGTHLFDTTLAPADITTLNRDLQVPTALMDAFAANGFALPSSGSHASRSAGEAWSGVSVSPVQAHSETNTGWFVTDRTRLWTYTVTATAAGASYKVAVELDAQLYLVPNQITLPHFPPLTPGYHVNGQLTVLGASLWVWVTVQMRVGGIGLSLPSGIQLAAFMSEIEIAGLLHISAGSDWGGEWFKNWMASAKSHQLHPGEDLPNGPMISLSTMSDEHAPEFLREKHFVLAGSIGLFELKEGGWLYSASVYVAILANGFAFDVELKLETVTLHLHASFRGVDADRVARPARASIAPPVPVAAARTAVSSHAALTGEQIEFDAFGRATVELGLVNLPGLKALLPSKSGVLLTVQVGLGVEHKPDAGVRMWLEVELTVFGINFEFTIDKEVDAEFLASLVKRVREFIEEVANAATVFAKLLGDSGFAQWLGSVLGGYLDWAWENNEVYLAEAMHAFERGVAEVAALMQGLGIAIELVKDAVKAVFTGDWSQFEAEIDRVFGLNLQQLVLAQRIGPQTAPGDYEALAAWVGGSGPDDLPALVRAGDWNALYAAEGQWLALLSMKFLAIIDIGVAFYDPSLASLKLSMTIPIVDVTLDLEITYRRVSEGLGVYTLQTTPPANWGAQSFGPAALTPPTIALSIYTNGDFLVDAGFPWDEDWTRAAHLQLGLLSGAGGFYFGVLPSASEELFPDTLKLNPILEAGLAVRLGYSASIDIGIMSGGIEASFLGIVQGAVGFDSSQEGNFLAEPKAIALCGQLAVAASIYAKVDFGIVSASVNLSLSVTVGFSVVTGKDIVLSLSATVTVSVHVRIHLFFFTITIGFRFSATVYKEITIPWTGEVLEPAREPVAFLAVGAVGEQIAAVTRRGRALPGGQPHAGAQLRSLPPLTLYFTPEVTLAYPAVGAPGVPQAVAGLTIERSAFNELAEAAAHWTLASASERFRQSGRIDRAELREVGLRLRANRRDPRRYGAHSSDTDPTAADYTKLTGYLAATFQITVAAVPVDGNERVVVPFPMMPEALLSVSGRANQQGETWPRDFRQYNLRDAVWREAVEAYLAALDVLSGARQRDVAEPGAALPVCEYLFVDYFQMLHEGAVETLDRALARSGANELHAQDIQTIDFEELAGNVVCTFRQGLQLPDGSAMVGLYELTGQQFALRAQVGQPYEMSLAPPPGVAWYASDGALTKLDPQAVAKLEAQPMPTPMRSDPTVAAFFREQPRTYPFANPITWQTPAADTYTLSAFPPALASDLAAAPGGRLQALLRQRNAADGPQAPSEPLAVGAAQALSVRIKVRRVPGSTDSYSLWAIDAAVLERVDLLLAAIAAKETPELEVDLLFAAGAAQGSVAAQDRAAVSLLRANLTTEVAPPNEQPQHLVASPEPLEPSVLASLEDVAGMLEILQWYGQTNAPGYYLVVSYPGGLPGSAFSGEEAELTLLVRAPTTPPRETKPVALARCFDTLVLGPLPASSSTELFYAAQAADSTGLVERAATVAPGVLPVEFSCPAPEPDNILGSLYSLLTYEIDGAGGFTASVTAVPARPALAEGTGEAMSIYRMFVPLARFAANPVGQNPYAAIGQNAQLTFRMRDCFGNELPSTSGGDGGRTVSYEYLYTDRLLSPGGWPGVQLSYDFAATSERTVLVVLAAPVASLDALRESGAAAACAQLRTAIYQLSGPHVELSLASSLDPSASAHPVGSEDAPYAPGSPTVAAFLESVLAYLQASEPPAPPLPCTIELRPSTPLSAQAPLEVAASLTVRRTQSVDEAVAQAVPEVAAVTGAASATPTKPASQLAADFAAAWSGYVLALAMGGGATAGVYALSVKLLDAEVLVGATQPPVYFSPAPLANALASGAVGVPAFAPQQQPPLGPVTSVAYTDTDLDESMAMLFAAMDTVLSPAAAAAAATRSQQALIALVRARAAVAQQYASHQLTWLFTEQTPVPPSPEDVVNREIAVSVLSAQLDASLQSAYQIQALLQCAVHWAAADAGAGVSESIDLYGTVAPLDASVSAVEASTAKVRIAPAGKGAAGRLTFTSTVDAATLEAKQLPHLDCKLSYTVTHVVLGEPGSTAAADSVTWLRLLEPRTLPLGSEEVAIPAPRRQFPVPPTLVSQAWEAPVLEPSPSLADLRGWSYAYSCSYLGVPQDSLTTTVSYDAPQAPHQAIEQAELAQLSLAQSLALFRQGYLQIAADLATLSDPAPSPDAGAALAYLEYLVQSVLANSDWNPASTTAHDGQQLAAQDELDLTFIEAPPEGCEAQGSLVLRLSSNSAAAVASATVTPCDAAGQPLPESQLHRCPYTPGELAKVVIYDLDPSPAWPQFVVRVDGLDAITRQSAWASVQTVRNADLLANFTTNAGFVYRSAVVRATRRTTPSLNYQDLAVSIPAATGHATGTVEEYMEWLLTDLLTPPAQSTAKAPSSYALRVGADFQVVFAWSEAQTVEGGQAPLDTIAARNPIVLSTTVELAPPGIPPRDVPLTDGRATVGELAAALATKLLAYLAQAPYASAEAELVLSITLFAGDPENPGAVLTLGRLELPIANLRQLVSSQAT
jgi:hypothetical protein